VEQFFKDLKHCIPSISPKIIFDVGANVGDFTKTSIRFFPKTNYFCFEPSKATNQKLKNISFGNNVSIYKIALSNVNDTLPFTKNHNLCNSLVVKKKSDDDNHDQDGLDIRIRALSGDDIETEIVQTKTLDVFCKEHDVNKIDILKIDTEGFDFEVLQGAEKMLSQKRIDIIYTELTFVKDINKFSRAFDVIDFLWGFDYEVFRFYDQASVGGKLRRANVVLTSSPIRQYNIKNIWN
jgi:FkbM family methyltransferase